MCPKSCSSALFASLPAPPNCAKAWCRLAFAAALLLTNPSAGAITVDVRLVCELNNSCGAGKFFYEYPEALDTLRFAAKAFEPFADQLTAIPASPSWTATFTNPDTGAAGFGVANLAVPENAVIIFAGGRDLPGNQVGAAAPGGPAGSQPRGQGIITGPSAGDFGMWGGGIAFDTLINGVPRNWHFGIDTKPGPGQIDFLSVAFHELAHIFGFGTSASFNNLMVGNQFLGPSVIDLTGGSVTIADGHHWAAGTTSPPYENEPASALTASLVLGRRTPLTPLDYAALKDIGWEVPDRLLGIHGDLDGDGFVDGHDFLRWQASFSSSAPQLNDLSGPQPTSDYDLWLWHNNVGARAAQAAPPGTVTIPEPGSILLMLLAMGSGLYFRRRRSQ